ncbi:MAG TPA: sensor histidine kinase [Gemmatimonadaceae bacterium]|nr:sensor histidine kinase [Gemmatimonadaceae bacterium]
MSRAELLGVFAFWTMLAVLTAANRLADQRELGLTIVSRTIPIALAFQQMYTWALITPLVFWLAGRFSIDRSNAAQRIALLLGIGVVAAFAVDRLNSSLVNTFRPRYQPTGLGFPGRPGGPGSGGFFSILRGPMILNHFIIYIGVLSAGFARDYFHRYRARERETARLQSETAGLMTQLAEARLSALNAQLNPHFLFNTLNAVSSLVERDPRGVRRMIARLSELLRYTLNGGSDNEVLLGQEIAFVERYLEIMQIRFQDRLEVDVQLGDDAGNALVPSLILQPLVENAVKHGVEKISGTGKIRIEARREDDRLVLSVSDNGPGPSGIQAAGAAAGEGGVGLENIRQRLEQLYGAAQSLVLVEAPDGGTVAQIVIPFRTRAELRTTVVNEGAKR